MSEICHKCGLPKDLCVCESIAKETQVIEIKKVKRKFGKISTIIQGIDEKEINIKDLAKKLKSKFACGGTVKNSIIELQGEHIHEAKQELIKLGFKSETIKTQ